jgi:hypothetical protein
VDTSATNAEDLAVILPRAHTAKIAGMLQRLERNKESLRVGSMGVSAPTLEDAFLAISKASSLTTTATTAATAAAAARSAGVGDAGTIDPTPAGINAQGDKEGHDGIGDTDDSRSLNGSGDGAGDGDGFVVHAPSSKLVLLTGRWQLVHAQFTAVWRRRWLHVRRDTKAIISQLGLVRR